MKTSTVPLCTSHPSSASSTRAGFSLRALVQSGLTLAVSLVATVAQAQSNYATPYIFTTLAGAAGVSGSIDGTGNAARFFQPHGVAVDASGVVYVADLNNHIIRKITPAGVVTTLAGAAGIPGALINGTGSAARFNSPRGVAVDSAGNVYVADSQNYAIRKITPDGLVSTLAGGIAGSLDGVGTAARFLSPYGIAVDTAGNVYVADAGNQAIRKITPAGVVTTLAGAFQSAGNIDGTGSGARFSNPYGVAVDPSGNVYVADRDNHEIRKITPAGVVTTMAGLSNGISGDADGTGSAARFATVEGVAADASGNVYVVDSTNSSIRKVTAAGVVTTLAGLTRSTGSTDGTGSAARFNSPQGIAVDLGGKVYVADTINHMIRFGQFPERSDYTLPYPIVTLAGTTSSGAADGTGNTARFFSPSAVAVDRFTGNLYVADADNHTIRKITPAGVVTTFAGTAGLSGPATANGTGSAARFNSPRGIAVHPNSSDVYVADTGNHAIRKITPDGVVTTLAGGTVGALDGAGSAARFFNPWGVAVDYNGNVYVGDSGNHAIRKVTSTGVVTTLAGVLGSSGSNDGVGGGARFSSPCGVAWDNNNLFVADRDNNTIRIVATFTIEGNVTTLAGVPGLNGSKDGFYSPAREPDPALRAHFNHPYGVAVDLRHDVYVADTGNSVIRKIAARDFTNDVVTTLAGLVGTVGSSDGTGSAARFNFPQGIVVVEDYTLYVADTLNHTIRKSVALAPSFDIQPPINQTVALGTSRFTWQWHWITNVPVTLDLKKNGVSIEIFQGSGGKNYAIPYADGNGFGFDVNNVEVSDLTAYTLTISNAAGSATSSTTLSAGAVNTGRLSNLSIRSNAGTGAQTLIVGFVVGGTGTTGTKPLLIRGVGPALGVFGVTGFLVDPSMSVFSGTTVVASNDNWNGDAQVTAIGGQVGAFGLGAPTGRDAALYSSALNPGSYTVQITGVGGTTGIALAEIYDATPADGFLLSTSRLINVSARTQVGTGSDILITGFFISGTTPRKLLIRAVGPTLGVFGVTGVLADPKLDLFSGTSVIQTNDNWGGGADIVAAAAGVGAFALDPASKDAVLLVTLQPGSYTAQVSGVSNTTGVALVEIYEVP